MGVTEEHSVRVRNVLGRLVRGVGCICQAPRVVSSEVPRVKVDRVAAINVCINIIANVGSVNGP